MDLAAHDKGTARQSTGQFTRVRQKGRVASTFCSSTVDSIRSLPAHLPPAQAPARCCGGRPTKITLTHRPPAAQLIEKLSFATASRDRVNTWLLQRRPKKRLCALLFQEVLQVIIFAPQYICQSRCIGSKLTGIEALPRFAVRSHDGANRFIRPMLNPYSRNSIR